MTATPTTCNTDQTQAALTPAEVEQFHRDGYLGPFALCTPSEMDAMRPAIEQVVETDAPDHRSRGHNRHLDQRLIYDLAAHPAIVNRMTAILGPDLLLWRTNFFTKQPGGLEIPWHQDYNYWPLEPAVICSAWLAIDETSVENSCLQIIPGSHRKVLPHIKATDDMQFGEMAQLHGVDMATKVDLEMKAGEFVLFNERTLHHSEANRSQKRRMGLAVRVIAPLVRVLKHDAPRHREVVIAGVDRMGFNPLCDPPAA